MKKKSLIVGISLALFALSANAKLIVNKSYVETGTAFKLEVVHNLNQRGDIYIGVLAKGSKLINAIPAKPRLVNVDLSVSHTVYDITIPVGLPQGDYRFFEIVTKVGGNPLLISDWVSDFNSVSQVLARLDDDKQRHYDLDNNGFADDDKDRDGFPENDLNFDGFHDDDANQDGFHDDDSNRDGFHDDDLDQDGFHDDDFNRDGFRDDDSNRNGHDDDDHNGNNNDDDHNGNDNDGDHNGNDNDGDHNGNDNDDDHNGNDNDDDHNGNSTSNGNAAKGASTYQDSCASSGCHGSNPANNQNDILEARGDAEEILEAIQKNKGGMGFLGNFVNADDANNIATYLNNL